MLGNLAFLLEDESFEKLVEDAIRVEAVPVEGTGGDGSVNFDTFLGCAHIQLWPPEPVEIENELQPFASQMPS